MGQIEVGKIYKHFKGKSYKVLPVAKSIETLEEFVVYEALYDNPQGQIWVRPLKMFVELVEIQGAKVPRFALMSLLLFGFMAFVQPSSSYAFDGNIISSRTSIESCYASEKLVREDLEQQCSLQRMKLVQIWLSECSDRDDGGYIIYFTVDGKGRCQ